MPSTTSHSKVVFPKVLVLGSAGRLGRILHRVWGAEGATWASRIAGPGRVVLDPLTQPHMLANLASDHDVVLCLAGVPPGRGDVSLNTALAASAVQAAVHTSCRTVFLASSAAVYGATPIAAREDQVLQPLTAYGREKLRMERTGLALGSGLNVRVCNLRIGNVAGADALLSGWHPECAVEQFIDGKTPMRSYIGPRDFAQTLRAVMRHWQFAPEVLNVALTHPVLMGALLDQAGLHWQARPARQSTLAKAVLDTSRLRQMVPMPQPENTAEHVIRDWTSIDPFEVAA